MFPDDVLNHLVEEDLVARRQAGLYRQRRALRVLSPTAVEIEGVRYIQFASNNYLGLTHHPRVCAAAADAITAGGLGSGAAGLVSGYTEDHATAERALARWKGAQDAVLLPSGYQANHAAVQTLAAMGHGRPDAVRFLVDKLAHASLIDAVRATGMPMRVFPHNHIDKLRRLLVDRDPRQLQVVITESIFSMDGDAANLPAIARLKQEHPFALLLDEAHATGVYGDRGQGYAAEAGVERAVDVSIVTLSKAMGSIGGAICASKPFCEAVVNHGRAFIFSTALPAAIARAAVAAIDVIQTEPHRRQRVRELAVRVRLAAKNAGFDVPAGDSPIVPVILGTESAAMAAADRLRERGLLVPAIRPPTVPKGTSRLRITLSCEHTNEEVEMLMRELREIGG